MSQSGNRTNRKNRSHVLKNCGCHLDFISGMIWPSFASLFRSLCAFLANLRQNGCLGRKAYRLCVMHVNGQFPGYSPPQTIGRWKYFSNSVVCGCGVFGNMYLTKASQVNPLDQEYQPSMNTMIAPSLAKSRPLCIHDLKPVGAG